LACNALAIRAFFKVLSLDIFFGYFCSCYVFLDIFVWIFFSVFVAFGYFFELISFNLQRKLLLAAQPRFSGKIDTYIGKFPAILCCRAKIWIFFAGYFGGSELRSGYYLLDIFELSILIWIQIWIQIWILVGYYPAKGSPASYHSMIVTPSTVHHFTLASFSKGTLHRALQIH